MHLNEHGRDPSSCDSYKIIGKLTETVRKNLHSPEGRKNKNQTYAHLSMPYTQPIARTWNNEIMSSGSGTE